MLHDCEGVEGGMESESYILRWTLLNIMDASISYMYNGTGQFLRRVLQSCFANG